MAPAHVVSAPDTPSQDEMGRRRGGPFIHLFIFLLFIYLFIYLLIHFFIFLFIFVFIHFSNIFAFVSSGGWK